MTHGLFGQSRSAREGRRAFGIGAMIGLVLNLSCAALFQPVSAYGQQPGLPINAIQQTVEGIRDGALAPVDPQSNALLQQQGEIYQSLFGQALQGAGSFYDLNVYPEEGGIQLAVNVENEMPVTLETIAVVAMDFDGEDLIELGLTPDEIDLWNQSTPSGNLVIGYLISDIGNAAIVGIGAAWGPVDGVQHPPMLTVLGTVEGFFGADRVPEDFVTGLPRPVVEGVESAQVSQGIPCPGGNVQPDQAYITCMGNAQITFEHCLIGAAITVAQCMAKVAIIQIARMLGCKRLVWPPLVKACLAVLLAWLVVQAALCTADGVAEVAQCVNDRARDRRICANELCGRNPPVVNPGPITPITPVTPVTPIAPAPGGNKAEQQLNHH